MMKVQRFYVVKVLPEHHDSFQIMEASTRLNRFSIESNKKTMNQLINEAVTFQQKQQYFLESRIKKLEKEIAAYEKLLRKESFITNIMKFLSIK